ncbi:MAG: AraC family transcriptional regulator [Eubacteriales bacterium]|nr:AraC family transcriptional regulator [Eubacteriales bacterium]
MVQQAVREILEKKGEAEAKLFQNLYAYQERLMHAVRHGEENIDFEGMDPIGNPYFLALSRPGLRNRKNQCIVYITLAAENAIAGGMELQEAYMLHSYYIQRLEGMGREKDIEALAREMLTEYAQCTARAALPVNLPQRVRQAITYIRKELGRPLTVAEVADAIGWSRSQMDRDFRTYLKCSPQQFIRREKIKKAEEYLHYTERSITQISQDLGFSSPSHFCNTFAKEVGITPSQCRRRAAESIGTSAEEV